jgi:hypothetical protein
MTYYPRRDNLNDLRNEGRFSDLFLTAWGIIENFSCESLLAGKRLSTQDPKSKKYIDMKVGLRINELWTMGFLLKSEYILLLDFKEVRNDLFHYGALFIVTMSQSDKENLANLATSAVDVIYEVFDRTHNY